MEENESAEIGVVGLGVMGRNLALNFRDRGFAVAVTDPWAEAREAFAAAPDREAVALAESVEELCARLARPRRLLLMVKAGEPVERLIETLPAHLSDGDIVIDGGNTHFMDSERRATTLAERGLHWLGLGISGGGSGARHGPSLMAGGAPAAFERVAPMLRAIAAKADGEPCCGYFGPGGAGHFVKTVHNGIEYAEMQLIAEIYHLMRDGLAMAPAAMSAAFKAWNQGKRGSYLQEITAKILTHREGGEDALLVDVIRDQAGQKGTGAWAAAAALELGVPCPTLAEAVAARGLSVLKPERLQAGDRLPGPGPELSDGQEAPSVAILGAALYAGRICAFAQGFALLAAAREAKAWQALDLAEVAAVWRAGCILRAGHLASIREAFAAEPPPPNLLVAQAFKDDLAATLPALRALVAFASARGIPAPALSASLAYYDGYRSAQLPANLIQAQRDYFGAHGFERSDRDGRFHGDWPDA